MQSDNESQPLSVIERPLEVSGHCLVDTVGYSEHVPLLKVTTPSGSGVKVFKECLLGSCNCVYYIGGNQLQLKPCRFASIISNVQCEWANDRQKLLWSVTDGFPIAEGEIPSYD